MATMAFVVLTVCVFDAPHSVGKPLNEHKQPCPQIFAAQETREKEENSKCITIY